MRAKALALAVAIGGAALAAPASAALQAYDFTAIAGGEEITGILTVDTTTNVVQSFTGTASGFAGGSSLFNGPVTLGLSSGGYDFAVDNKFFTSPDYFSPSFGGVGDCCGLGLTTTNAGTNYNFRLYDYVNATPSNFGPRLAWFGSSGGEDATITFTAIPEPSTWALMLAGFIGLAGAGYASRRRGAVAVL
jgi:PEP-CTERM motif